MKKKQGVLAEQCCECGNCVNICPADAISFQSETPFLRRAVADGKLCIGCNRCEQVCPSLNPVVKRQPLKIYGALSTSSKVCKSTSGGIFPELAEEVLAQGGSVVGAAYNSDWSVSHHMVSEASELRKLQGSKYLKSDVKDSFRQTKEKLGQGQTVLYCGTPCQIAALYRSSGDRLSDNPNLITVDFVCHGTPPAQLFKEYADLLETKNKGKLIDFTFRDKRFGQRAFGCYTIEKRGKAKVKPLYCDESSYYKLFSDGCICSEACYSCPYTTPERVADFTLCDFWHWQEEIAGILANPAVNEKSSISATIINTKKAEQLFEKIKGNLIYTETEYERVIRHNPQLRKPTFYNADIRSEIIKEYNKDGYSGIERYFIRQTGLKRYSSRISLFIPKKLKNAIKKLIKH